MTTTAADSPLSPHFQLWRQDDNGNRYLVATFAQRSDAEQAMAALTRSLHKQFYWIAESRDELT